MSTSDSTMGDDTLANASIASSIWANENHPLTNKMRRMRQECNEAKRAYRSEYVALSLKDMDAIEDQGTDVDALRHELGGKIHHYIRESRLLIHDADINAQTEVDMLKRIAMSVCPMRDVWEETRYFYSKHNDVITSIPDDQRIRLPTREDPRFASVGEKRHLVNTTTATQESNVPDAARFRSSSPKDDSKQIRMPSFSVDQGSKDGTPRRPRKGISPVTDDRVGEWVTGQSKKVPEIILLDEEGKGNSIPTVGEKQINEIQPTPNIPTNTHIQPSYLAPPPSNPSTAQAPSVTKDGGGNTKGHICWTGAREIGYEKFSRESPGSDTATKGETNAIDKGAGKGQGRRQGKRSGGSERSGRIKGPSTDAGSGNGPDSGPGPSPSSSPNTGSSEGTSRSQSPYRGPSKS